MARRFQLNCGKLGGKNIPKAQNHQKIVNRHKSCVLIDPTFNLMQAVANGQRHLINESATFIVQLISIQNILVQMI